MNTAGAHSSDRRAKKNLTNAFSEGSDDEETMEAAVSYLWEFESQIYGKQAVNAPGSSSKPTIPPRHPMLGRAPRSHHPEISPPTKTTRRSHHTQGPHV